MSSFQKFAQSPYSLLKQALVFAVLTAIVISLFPFVKYRTNDDLSLLHESQDRSKVSNLNVNEKILSTSKIKDHSEREIDQSWSVEKLHSYFKQKNCIRPAIPKISTTPESEAKTIKEINHWIDCHNAWNADLNRLVELKNKMDRERGNRLDRLLQELVLEDRVNIELVSGQYSEWKNNSLNYKQRLGFRRNLLSDSSYDTH